MTKYHINKHGVPAICRAQEGNCPIGSANQHFSTREEAREHADAEAEKEHGFIPGLNSLNERRAKMAEAKKAEEDSVRGYVSPDVSGEKLDNLNGKDVRVLMDNGNEYDGAVYSVDQTDGKRELRMETPNGMEKVDLNKAQFIEASKLPYHNLDYQNAIKKTKLAKGKFRFEPRHLNELENKYVEVEYEGKQFDGKVVGTNYISHKESGLIIESDNGEVKHIKNYRLDDLEVVSDNEADFKNYKQVRDFSNESTQEIRELEAPDAPENSSYDPDDEAERYLRDVIKAEKGEDVDLKDNHRVDWEVDVIDNKDGYYLESFGNSGELRERWDTSSQEAYEGELDKAVDTNEYYETKKELIDDLANKARETDWTKHGKSQKQGVIDALEYISERELTRQS